MNTYLGKKKAVMKRWSTILIIGLAILGLGIDSLAESEQRSVWELGAEMSWITYKEPGVMKETGEMYGIVGSYTYYESNLIGDIDYIKIDGRLTWGTVNYDGSTQDGVPLTMSNIPDAMREFRVLGGIDLGPSKTVTTTPAVTLYAGLGSRYLNDDSSAVYDYGYERESYYSYIPVGINIDISSDKTPAWITLEYDYFLGGTQISYLSDAVPGLNDVENEQDDGYGFRCSIKVRGEKNAGDHQLFVRYWNIKDSDLATLTYYGTPVGYGLEPKNNSLEIGWNAVWRF